jgi:hypothetical protein
MTSPTRYPFPFDRHDCSASNTTPPTSDPILEVEHPLARLQPKPGQECRCQQRRVSASGAVDLDEIPPPEILDPGRIQRDHLHAFCSLLVPSARASQAGPRRQSGTNLARTCGALKSLCRFLDICAARGRRPPHGPPPLWPMVDPHQCAGWLRALARCDHATLEPSHAGVAHALWRWE